MPDKPTIPDHAPMSYEEAIKVLEQLMKENAEVLRRLKEI